MQVEIEQKKNGRMYLKKKLKDSTNNKISRIKKNAAER